MRQLHVWLPMMALLAGCTGGDSSPRRPGGGSTAGTAEARAPSDPRVAIADTARIKGAADAPVWIVEVSDFQCPFCRDWQQRTYPLIEREYIATGKAKLAYMNFPLPNHRHAMLAAEVALCAGAQGRFWPVHDGLFATQARWSGLADARPVFDSVAAAGGADMGPLRDCVNDGVMRPLIQADLERSGASGAGSTPTFLLLPDSTLRGAQPVMLVGAQPFENFQQAIDSLLAHRAAGGRN